NYSDTNFLDDRNPENEQELRGSQAMYYKDDGIKALLASTITRMLCVGMKKREYILCKNTAYQCFRLNGPYDFTMNWTSVNDQLHRGVNLNEFATNKESNTLYLLLCLGSGRD